MAALLVDLRDWTQFCFLVAGGTAGIAAFLQNMRQRRVENALKLVANFHAKLRPGDLLHFEQLVRKHSGSNPSEFSEGPENDYALSRMFLGLEVICHEVNRKTVDARIVFYELGQFLVWCRDWIGPAHDQAIFARDFPNVAAFFAKYGARARHWPCYVYTFRAEEVTD